MLSMLSEKLTRKLEAKLDAGFHFGELGLVISLIVVNAISTNNLVATVRAVLVAPRIVEELVPVLVGLLLVPFCVAMLTVVFNGTFLALSGGFIQAFARVLLVVPSDQQNIVYFCGMTLLILGHALVFTGMLGFIFKNITVQGRGNGRELHTTAIIAGMMLGFGMNIVTRMPGVQLAETMLVNTFFSGLLVVFTITWYVLVDKKHNIIKNLDETEGFNAGKEKRFGKTLHVLLLGPCVAVLGFTFNRYEWLAAITGLPYWATAYVSFLSIMLAPIIGVLASRHEKGRDILVVALLAMASIGVGLSQVIQAPWLVLAGMLVAPAALFMAMLQNIKLARQERVNNIDITFILTWIISISSIITLAVLSLLVFFPYATFVVFSPVLAQEIVRLARSRRRMDA